MRDPDLVVRAQRAATALESAWCHWRNMHGLAADPPPAVSSYVGYSLDAPWGEARIVFGICAEEAEQLAILLDRHDCVGPVHAAAAAGSGVMASARAGSGTAGSGTDGLGLAGAGASSSGSDLAEGGWFHVPAPSPASAGQQPLSPSAGLSRHGAALVPRHRDPARDDSGASPLTAPSAPIAPDIPTPIALAASRAVQASSASRRALVTGLAATASREPSGPDSPGDDDDHPSPAGRSRPGAPGQAAAARSAFAAGQAVPPAGPFPAARGSGPMAAEPGAAGSRPTGPGVAEPGAPTAETATAETDATTTDALPSGPGLPGPVSALPDPAGATVPTSATFLPVPAAWTRAADSGADALPVAQDDADQTAAFPVIPIGSSSGQGVPGSRSASAIRADAPAAAFPDTAFPDTAFPDTALPDTAPVARLPIAARLPGAPPGSVSPAPSRLLVVPEVVAFRPKRTSSAAGRPPAGAAGAVGTVSPESADTVQTPAPGRIADGHDRRPMAPRDDASPWAATEEAPGPAAITDTAV